MLETVELLTLDTTVNAPAGIIYSTAPRRAEGQDGESYFVKGPDLEIVVPEIAGNLFANAAGLLVPEPAVCVFEGQRLAGSRRVADSMRDVSSWLARPQKIRNAADLFNVIIVDAWLANNDRNLGNVLGRATHGSEIEVVMIDFEKSKTLRPNPIMESGMVNPRALWPTGELGQVLRTSKPPHPPQQMLDRVRAMDQAHCFQVIQNVRETLRDFAWWENSIQVLAARASRITQIAEEVWQSK
jgi:hypothetical protein